MRRRYGRYALGGMLLLTLLLVRNDGRARLLDFERVPASGCPTIVFFGDSITEADVWPLLVSSYIAGRFPDREFRFYNRGLTSDTARDGDRRYAADVEPLDPDLVFIAFGMNDGGYEPPDARRRHAYLRHASRLTRRVIANGATPVLLTPSPVDYAIHPQGDVYNETLAGLSAELTVFAGQDGLTAIDVFTPLRAWQRQYKETYPGATLISDGTHPDVPGHLLLAYTIMRRLAVPPAVADITVGARTATAATGRLTEVSAQDDGTVRFTLLPAGIPFYVPPEARQLLDLVPLQEECNRFRLQADTAAFPHGAVLSVAGRELAAFTAARLADGADLALLDEAPWCVQAKALQQVISHIFAMQKLAWRKFGNEAEAWQEAMPAFQRLREAQEEYNSALFAEVRRQAQPETYPCTLRPAHIVPLAAVELSPVYPATGDFSAAYPPEQGDVTWRRVAGTGRFDLARLLGNPANSVCYVRVRLRAAASGTAILRYASDDGCIVLLNSERVRLDNATQWLPAPNRRQELELRAGDNELLLRVNNRGGGFGVDFTIEVPDGEVTCVN